MIGGIALISMCIAILFSFSVNSLISFVHFFPIVLCDVSLLTCRCVCHLYAKLLFPGLAQTLSYCGAYLLPSLKNIFDLVFNSFIHAYEVSWSDLPFVNLFLTHTPSELFFQRNPLLYSCFALFSNDTTSLIMDSYMCGLKCKVIYWNTCSLPEEKWLSITLYLSSWGWVTSAYFPTPCIFLRGSLFIYCGINSI